MALILTAAQMARSDRWASEFLQVPGRVLMESAGRGVAEIVLRHRATGERTQGPVVVVCGGGHNGGDGFVVARHLVLAGVPTRVLMTRPYDALTGDPAACLTALSRMGGASIVDASEAQEVSDWTPHLKDAAIIVDALFGTGLRSGIEGVPAAAIAAMNACAGAWRIAVDLPSGLDADSGATLGIAVQADVTATIAARKPGLVLDVRAGVGEIAVVPLGVPLFAPSHGGPYMHWVDESDVRARLPRTPPDAHKGTRGHVLLVAGTAGTTGAALLSADAALRGGAGMVTIASTGLGQRALDGKVKEAMTAAFCAGDDADADSFARIAALLPGKKAAALGPGIPRGSGMRDLARRLAAELDLPLVIDADGLNHLGPDLDWVLSSAPAARILTPHPGEAARLLGTTPEAVQADRLGCVRRLAALANAVVVLKGARSLIALPDGTVYVNPHADPSLGTAGSGDVLTGLIAALLGQGLSALDAAISGVYAHGAAAELARATLGTGNLLAGDLPLGIARWLSSYATDRESRAR